MITPRILDYDGAPHNADTGAPVHGVDGERKGHWIDDLPATPLDGIKLVSLPSDMVMDADGNWMRRDEYDARQFKEAV